VRRCGPLLHMSHVAWSVSARRPGTRMSGAKTDEPIEMTFKEQNLSGPGDTLLSINQSVNHLFVKASKMTVPKLSVKDQHGSKSAYSDTKTKPKYVGSRSSLLERALLWDQIRWVQMWIQLQRCVCVDHTLAGIF